MRRCRASSLTGSALPLPPSPSPPARDTFIVTLGRKGFVVHTSLEGPILGRIDFLQVSGHVSAKLEIEVILRSRTLQRTSHNIHFRASACRIFRVGQGLAPLLDPLLAVRREVRRLRWLGFPGCRCGSSACCGRSRLRLPTGPRTATAVPAAGRKIGRTVGKNTREYQNWRKCQNGENECRVYQNWRKRAAF